MVILQHEQIVFKIFQRMAAEIIERHTDEPTFILAGINNGFLIKVGWFKLN